MELQSSVIREARIQKGWTQQQLSEVASLSLRTIQRVETTGQGSLETCNALCAVLELARDDVLQFEPPHLITRKWPILLSLLLAVGIGFLFGVLATLALS